MSFLTTEIKQEDWVRLSTWIPYALLVWAIAINFQGIFYNLSNPIDDMHGFRQTQTAISSYYFIKEGFSLNYQTLNQFGDTQGVTPYSNAGNASLLLPGDWQRVTTTAEMSNQQLSQFNQQIERQNLQLAAEANFTNNWQGYISEIIIFDKKLSKSYRKEIEVYLGTKYGIEVAQ